MAIKDFTNLFPASKNTRSNMPVLEDDPGGDRVRASHVNKLVEALIAHEDEIGDDSLPAGSLRKKVADLESSPVSHATEHITGGSDTISVATSSSTGLCPILSGDSNDALRGDGSWGSVSASLSMDDTYNVGHNIDVDDGPIVLTSSAYQAIRAVSTDIGGVDRGLLELNLTQNLDSEYSLKISHNANDNQGSAVSVTASPGDDGTQNGEILRGINLVVTKKVPATEVWFEITSNAIAKKTGGSWSVFSESLAINEYHDIKGVTADDVWLVGRRPISNGYAGLAHYNGVSWSDDTAFNTAFANDWTYNDGLSVLPISAAEIYVLFHTQYYNGLYVVRGDGAGNWTDLTSGSYADLSKIWQVAKNDTKFAVVCSSGIRYTNDVSGSSPTWATDSSLSSFSYGGGIVEDSFNNRLIVGKCRTTSYPLGIEFFYGYPGSWTSLGGYDFSSTYGPEMERGSMWADNLGNIFAVVTDSSKTYLIHSIETGTPVAVEYGSYYSYGIYGISSNDIRFGTTYSSNVGVWNGSELSSESTIFGHQSISLWGNSDPSGTGRFRGIEVSFDGLSLPNNEAAAIKIGSGAIYALLAESGLIGLNKLTEAPASLTNKGLIYTRDISGTVELCYTDDDDNEKIVSALATASTPGLCPTLSGDTSEFLRGDGSWSTVAASGLTLTRKYLGEDTEVGVTSPALAVYQFDGTGSELNDRTGNGYTLTVENGTRYYTSIEGLKAIWFNGSTNFIGPDTEDLRIDGALSIEAVIYSENPASDVVALICASDGVESPQNNTLYQMNIRTSGVLRYNHEYGSGADAPIDSESCITYVPHLVSVTRNSACDTLNIYLDGVLIQTASISNGPQKDVSGNTQRLYVGSSYGLAAPFKGAISSVRVCNAELTANQVLNVYKEIMCAAE